MEMPERCSQHPPAGPQRKDATVDKPILRKTTREVAAGDPFQVAGSRLLNLLAATVGDDTCCECGIPLNTLGGEGLPSKNDSWICAECAEQRSYS
jgi:hypothetical protein